MRARQPLVATTRQPVGEATKGAEAGNHVGLGKRGQRTKVMDSQPVEQVHELGRHTRHHRQQTHRQRGQERCRCLRPCIDDHRFTTAR